MKLKKDVKPQLSKLPRLKIKYNLMVPLIGLVDAATMFSFYRNPVSEGNLFFKVFFIFSPWWGWALLIGESCGR